MTEAQALRKARKLWGKNAAVEVSPKGGFIGDDHRWHESIVTVCEHGKHYQRCAENKNCPLEFYVKSRDPLVLGRMKYRVPKYQVGKIMLGMFFEVRGCAESFERAFEIALTPGHLWT
jgi:hypothetical protein